MDITNIKDIDNIIIDYKYQLETQEKFKKCIKDIPNCRIFKKREQEISSYNHIKYEFIFYYDKINKKYIDYTVEKHFRYYCDIIRHNTKTFFECYSNCPGYRKIIYFKK
jgi:hypothetical protein